MSIKVVIIEDHPITLRSLSETIDWASLDCEIAGTAPNGMDGYKLCLDVQPDILLTDISMPHKDGLQMVEELREEMPDLKVIIITGYDQFQYASRAIKLAVFDYILKPIRNEEVIRSVQRAAREIQRMQEIGSSLRLRQQTQLLSLLTNMSRAGLNVYQMMEDVGMRAGAYYFIIVQPEALHSVPMAIMYGIDSLLSTVSARTLSIMLYDSLVLYVMRDDLDEAWQDEAAQLVELIADAVPVRVRFGISELEKSYHKVRKTYQQARQALWETAMSQEGTLCCFYSQVRTSADASMAQIHQKLGALIERADLSDEFAQEASRTIVDLSGQQYSHLRALVSLYVLMFSKKFPSSNNSQVEKALNDAWYVTCEAEVSGCLAHLSAVLRQDEQPDQSKYSLLTKNVLEYIRLHGAESLKLNDVAEHFRVSSNYLSALISRETGTLFHAHVLRVKMEIAHTLLADPRVRVEEVAHAVGYSNYVSFYNVFKRLEHMTPSQYREMLASQQPESGSQ